MKVKYWIYLILAFVVCVFLTIIGFRDGQTILWLLFGLISLALLIAIIAAILYTTEDARSTKKPKKEPPKNPDEGLCKPNENEWRCPECGSVNQSFAGTCGCGYSAVPNKLVQKQTWKSNRSNLIFGKRQSTKKENGGKAPYSTYISSDHNGNYYDISWKYAGMKDGLKKYEYSIPEYSNGLITDRTVGWAHIHFTPEESECIEKKSISIKTTQIEVPPIGEKYGDTGTRITGETLELYFTPENLKKAQQLHKPNAALTEESSQTDVSVVNSKGNPENKSEKKSKQDNSPKNNSLSFLWEFDSVLTELITKGEDIVDYLNTCHAPYNIISKITIDNKEYKCISKGVLRGHKPVSYDEYHVKRKDIYRTFEFSEKEILKDVPRRDLMDKIQPVSSNLSDIPYLLKQNAFYKIYEDTISYPARQRSRSSYSDIDRTSGEMYRIPSETEMYTEAYYVKEYHHLVTLDLKSLVSDWDEGDPGRTRYAKLINNAFDGIVPIRN